MTKKFGGALTGMVSGQTFSCEPESVPAVAHKGREALLSSFNRARRGVRGKLKETKSQIKSETRNPKSETPKPETGWN
jgi:hypothetical protein